MLTVTVELVVFTVRQGRLETLLMRRPGTAWGVPGGPPGPGQGLEAAALAALDRQAGLRGIRVEQLYTFDRPGEGVAVAYLALIDAERHPVAPGPDVVEVRWFTPDDLPALAPDHQEALDYGRERLRAKTRYAPIAFQLLPDVFTLGRLQAVYEAVLGHSLDARNFRRDVLAAGVVAPVGRVSSEGRGRPAHLYRSTPGAFAVVAAERRGAREAAGDAGVPEDAR